MSEHISKSAAEPVGPYPHSRSVGDFLYISGMGPREKGKKEIPGVTLGDHNQITDYDIVTQTKAVFKNIEFILKENKLELNHLVDITVFLTNMKDDFHKFNEVYKECLKGARPCRTTVEVKSLPTPIAVELKCIAYRGE